MPMNIKKSVQDYLAKIKTPRPSQIHLPSKKWMILGGCKHPRTPSFSLFRSALRGAGGSGSVKKNNSDNEATLADVDRFLVENFRSLFLGDGGEDEDNNNNTTRRVLPNNEESSHGGKSPKPAGGGPASSFDSFEEQPPTGLTGSRRYFLTRGFSGSSSSASTAAVRNNGDSPLSAPRETAAAFPDNCVAVLAYSKSPYEGFKRSMEGVVEERLKNNEKVDWDFMEELLSCYMSMNEKGTHKFILAAFVDVIAIMRRGPPQPAPAKGRSVRTVRIGGEIRKKNEVEGSLSS